MLPSKRWTICVALAIGLAATAGAQTSGHYTGEPLLTLLPDGRNMELTKAFGYTDPRGKSWNVPPGTKTDGASIPRFLWISYPPFTGKYRAAAVIHDYYCQQQSRGWKETHRVFYDAMLTSGVSEQTAKVMYAAVYSFGPRWGTRSERGAPGPQAYPTADKQDEFMRDLKAWVARENPSPEELERGLERGTISKKVN